MTDTPPLGPQCRVAVDLLAARLGTIPHPTKGLLRLVQFAHDSPGLRDLRKAIAEGLVLLLESNGITLCNGTDDAKALLVSHGYTVRKAPTKAPTKRTPKAPA